MDLRAARAEPDRLRAALERKGAGGLFDELLDVDRRKREVQERVESLRAARKTKGKPTEQELAELERTKPLLQAAEAELGPLEDQLDRILARIPNPPEEDAPSGGEDDFAVLREVGEPPAFDFEPRDHLDLAAERGWIDLERGAKVSGSRFAFRVGELALTELALYRWALDRLVADGFTPVIPPVLVREEAMYGTGFFPAERFEIYEVADEGLYLTGTSEVALAGLHMSEILEADELPKHYTAFSANFRREAGAAGRDTRGMFRVHQFNKVELFSYVLPEASWEEHDRLVAIEEALVQELGLPYRVLNIATGELSAAAAKRIDIEAWFPSQGRYREITSASNTTDYQARRLGIRYRANGGTEFVHTLNGTAVTDRWVLAILENFAGEVPQVLRGYGAPERVRSDA
jgi:seryl-tRNA synthetase